MLKILRNERRLARLDAKSLAEAAILERSDLQEFIANDPDSFFGEIGETLFVLGTEVRPSETVEDRIDILAVDKDARLVIVELKRGNNKYQLLQAISYAAMVSRWTADEVIELAGPKADAMADFLDVESEELNGSQRIILVAEAYDYEVLAASDWLVQMYGVQVACCRIAVAVDNVTGTEFLTCSQILPAPELAEQALARGRRSAAALSQPEDWETVLGTIELSAMREFVQRRLSDAKVSNARHRVVYVRVADKLRFHLEVRRKHCTVLQLARFEGDVEFWKSRLSDPDSVQVKKSPPLRFFLCTAEDCDQFDSALETLKRVTWVSGSGIARATQPL